MACQGPSKRPDFEVQKITDEVIAFLKEKGHINRWSREKMDKMFPKFKESRNAANQQLKEAIAEILWCDDCDSW